MGTSEGPMDSLGGGREGGKRVDKGVPQPGPGVGVMCSSKEGISWVECVV